MFCQFTLIINRLHPLSLDVQIKFIYCVDITLVRSGYVSVISGNVGTLDVVIISKFGNHSRARHVVVVIVGIDVIVIVTIVVRWSSIEESCTRRKETCKKLINYEKYGIAYITRRVNYRTLQVFTR